MPELFGVTIAPIKNGWWLGNDNYRIRSHAINRLGGIENIAARHHHCRVVHGRWTSSRKLFSPGVISIFCGRKTDSTRISRFNCSTSWFIRWKNIINIIWRFPKIGVPLVIILISRWDFTVSTSQLLGTPHGHGNPHMNINQHSPNLGSTSRSDAKSQVLRQGLCLCPIDNAWQRTVLEYDEHCAIHTI